MNTAWVVISLKVVIIIFLSLAPIQICTGAYLLAPSSFYWSWQKSVRNHRSSKQNQQQRADSTRNSDRTRDPITDRDRHPIDIDDYDKQDVTSLLKQDNDQSSLRKPTPKATSYYSLPITKTPGRTQPSFMDLLHIFDARNSKRRRNSDSERIENSVEKTIVRGDGDDSTEKGENKVKTLQSYKMSGSRDKNCNHKRNCRQSPSPSRKTKTRLKFGPWRGKRSIDILLKVEKDSSHDRDNSEMHKKSSKSPTDSKFLDHVGRSSVGKEPNNVFQIWRPEYVDKNETNVNVSLNNKGLNNSQGENVTSDELLLQYLKNRGRLYSQTLDGHLRGIANDFSNRSQIQIFKAEMMKISKSKQKGGHRGSFVQGEGNGKGVVSRQNTGVEDRTRVELKGGHSRDFTQSKGLKKENDNSNDDNDIGKYKIESEDIGNSKDRKGDTSNPTLVNVIHNIPHKTHGRFHFRIFDEDKKRNERKLGSLYRKINLWARIEKYLHAHNRNVSKQQPLRPKPKPFF